MGVGLHRRTVCHVTYGLPYDIGHRLCSHGGALLRVGGIKNRVTLGRDPVSRDNQYTSLPGSPLPALEEDSPHLQAHDEKEDEEQREDNDIEVPAERCEPHPFGGGQLFHDQ